MTKAEIRNRIRSAVISFLNDTKETGFIDSMIALIDELDQPDKPAGCLDVKELVETLGWMAETLDAEEGDGIQVVYNELQLIKERLQCGKYTIEAKPAPVIDLGEWKIISHPNVPATRLYHSSRMVDGLNLVDVPQEDRDIILNALNQKRNE